MFKHNPPLSPQCLALARTEGLTMALEDILCGVDAMQAVLKVRLPDDAEWWLAAHGLRGEIVGAMLVLRKW